MLQADEHVYYERY